MSEPRQNHDGAGIPPGMTKHNKESWVKGQWWAPPLLSGPVLGQRRVGPRRLSEHQSLLDYLKDIPWEQIQEEDSRLTLPFLTVQAADKNTCVKFINGRNLHSSQSIREAQ